MDKISIIVPIYNVEKYLEKCLNSIINQTYKNIEIILIDDGSTDNSKNICDIFAHNDKRIKVIHQNNSGLSGARNSGLKVCSGKYISFIDSDDYVTNDYVEYLYDLIKNYNGDISCVSINSKRNKEKITIIDKPNCIKELVNFDSGIEMCVMNKLYKRSIIGNFFFDELTIYEDILFNGIIFTKINRIIVSNLKKYCYLIRNDSLSNGNFSIMEYDRTINSYKLYELINKSYNEYSNIYKLYYYANCVGCINKMILDNVVDMKYVNKIRRELKKDITILWRSNYSLRRKIQLGIFCLCFMFYKMYYKTSRRKK